MSNTENRAPTPRPWTWLVPVWLLASAVTGVLLVLGIGWSLIM